MPCWHAPLHITTNEEFSPEQQQAYEMLLEEYEDALEPIESDIQAWVSGASDDDLRSLEAIDQEIRMLVQDEARVGEFEAVFREGGERGAEAGRELASRRYGFDIAFDVVPERTLEEIDDWVETAAGSTLETITEDTTRWLRGAHKEGLSIDDIAARLNEEFFDGHLEDYVAERAARTATISTSNAGSHSAYEDVDAVVGEEWLATDDDRTRDSHRAANGQIVPVDETFDVGGVHMRYPGDPTAPVGELANCRCTPVPVFADELSEDELDRLLDGERLNA